MIPSLMDGFIADIRRWFTKPRFRRSPKTSYNRAIDILKEDDA